MKGLIIANCGAMGLNWERLSLSGYIEAMNARNSDGETEKADTSDLKRFMEAHGNG